MATDQAKAKPRDAQQKLELLDDDPAAFELFVKWLYQGRLDNISELSDEAKYDYAVACHKLYRLCERLDMPELKNLSMDQYRLSLFEAQLVPDADEINEIYTMSKAGSPFRRLMIKIAARQVMDPDSDKDAENYRAAFKANPDFAVDMVNAIKAGTGGMLFEDPTEGGECEYHDHSQGAGCNFIPRQRPKSESRPCRPRSNPLLNAVKAHAYTHIAKQNKPRKIRLPDGDPTQMLKALPTTSTDSSSASEWLSDTTLTSPDSSPEAAPTTVARPTAPAAKTDTKAGERRGVDDPLNYVAALRMRQEGRRKSSDLFDGIETV